MVCLSTCQVSCSLQSCSITSFVCYLIWCSGVGRESCKGFAASNRRGAILHSHICKKLCRTGRNPFQGELQDLWGDRSGQAYLQKVGTTIRWLWFTPGIRREKPLQIAFPDKTASKGPYWFLVQPEIQVSWQSMKVDIVATVSFSCP